MVNIKQFYSVKEAAQLLNLSRIAIFKKIKAGKIEAELVGRGYIIKASTLGLEPISELSQQDKSQVGFALKRILAEYNTTLLQLGKE